MCLASICPAGKSSSTPVPFPPSEKEGKGGTARTAAYHYLPRACVISTPLSRDVCMVLQGCLSVRQLWSACKRQCSVSTIRAESCSSTSLKKGEGPQRVPGGRRGCGYSRRPRSCRSIQALSATSQFEPVLWPSVRSIVGIATWMPSGGPPAIAAGAMRRPRLPPAAERSRK
ncbi:hypothetical protein K458DRAFT_44826 [Lentithecium fluviatile CBS 122367]|uniref:Uncharacterized protein n=1 Tax=Lentithecium fluviatile CBS 122367 TaxID=1168545 RepID=A0A6G1IZD9_9PLEO|nr:hypothetical protein K458DRAFT_44826 [Lentithecium fluviatile CBS 122367]